MDELYANRQSVTCSEILNSGARLSAREDFVQRTLSSLRGIWSKLNYIRQLRGRGSNYEHWGLKHVHGEESASRAIADVHTELYIELLRTPLPQLMKELESGTEGSDESGRDLAQTLKEQQQKIVPQNLCGGAPEHLDFVLTSISLLTAAGVDLQEGRDQSVV